MILFKSSSHNMAAEFETIDSRLRFVFLAYAMYMHRKFTYDATVTCVIRTDEEQDNIYANSEGYKLNPWMSVHQVRRGLDFRSKDMTSEMLDATLKFFNQVKYTGEKGTVIRHSVVGDHFHLQVDPDGVTGIIRI